MSITGIISEYNPFHNGHKYLIKKHKEKFPDSYFIAVMSGNFTQRGETALVNKWQRAKLAVANGIDLVIELPFVFTVRSAQYFAKGGIDLLQKLHCVDSICFGSEYTNEKELTFIAQTAQSEKFQQLLKTSLSDGQSYAATTSKILSNLTGISENILKAPNAILGIEYLKANLNYPQPLQVNIIQRVKAEHNDLNYQENFASGTAIRHSLYTNNNNFSKLKQVVPNETFSLLQEIHQKQDLPYLDYIFTTLITKLRLAKIEELSNIYGIREGLEYKLLKAANEATDLADFYQQLKSKRYPLTNLQRLCLYLLLNITKEMIQTFDDTGVLYARILAFNDKGTQIIKQMKKNASIPIITKTTSYLDSKKRCQQKLTTFEEMLAIDTYATELYNLCFKPFKPYGQDFTTSPYYLQR
ncbi:nucleotidyltransferase [uncultured Megamonas sp.]|uniref:nucleotidyltransferase n=1 Tax=uncultured Megamonas sp. TaxID=286140 RepID=UPI0025DB6D0A|nr:nucleotidyltransferase [uncultured Megamonas sp.]